MSGGICQLTSKSIAADTVAALLGIEIPLARSPSLSSDCRSQAILIATSSIVFVGDIDTGVVSLAAVTGGKLKSPIENVTVSPSI
jgi:hypothetical protein